MSKREYVKFNKKLSTPTCGEHIDQILRIGVLPLRKVEVGEYAHVKCDRCSAPMTFASETPIANDPTEYRVKCTECPFVSSIPCEKDWD